jgi:phosphatidylinositol kinase/protein kinase (PI-3  family)
VTPLNEECGLIEWVDNLRTLREIIIKALRERGISPNVSLWGPYQDCWISLLTSAIVQRDQALFGRNLRRSIILKTAVVHDQNLGQVCSKVALFVSVLPY